MSPRAVSVRQLNVYVKSLLESDVHLTNVSVVGEISNCKVHFGSGHCYFTLKDEYAAIKCVMFRSYAERNKTDMQNGKSVVCVGRVSMYEKDGAYQMYVEAVYENGVGLINETLEELKQKLLKEGLFDQSHKRTIPKYPDKIGVVTSAGGAALQDICNILKRRYPVCEMVLCPASVQGVNAANEIIKSLNTLAKQKDIDTVIIARGGGSSEDLDAFNNEALARTVYAMPFPVISAVGHETDFTVCDLVADLRVPTPSAAAEVAVPDKSEILNRIEKYKRTLKNNLDNRLNSAQMRYNSVVSRGVFKYPERIFDEKQIYADRLCEKINNTVNLKINASENKAALLIEKIDALGPLKVLSRGFSVASKNGVTVKCVNDVDINDNITLRLSDGKLNCTVKEKIYE